MTNTRAAHFGRAILLTIKYGSELEQLHHQYNDALLKELRCADIDEDMIDLCPILNKIAEQCLEDAGIA